MANRNKIFANNGCKYIWNEQKNWHDMVKIAYKYWTDKELYHTFLKLFKYLENLKKQIAVIGKYPNVHEYGMN